MVDPQESFEKWYVDPLKKLKELPNRNGGFVTLAVSCILYERYAKTVIKQRNENADELALTHQLISDFNTDGQTARSFWNIIRSGLLHQAMPKVRERGEEVARWAFHSSFTQPLAIRKVNGKDTLCVEPWLFADKVISLWQNNLDLLSVNESFPWAQVAPIKID